MFKGTLLLTVASLLAIAGLWNILEGISSIFNHAYSEQTSLSLSQSLLLPGSGLLYLYIANYCQLYAKQLVAENAKSKYYHQNSSFKDIVNL